MLNLYGFSTANLYSLNAAVQHKFCITFKDVLTVSIVHYLEYSIINKQTEIKLPNAKTISIRIIKC